MSAVADTEGTRTGRASPSRQPNDPTGPSNGTYRIHRIHGIHRVVSQPVRAALLTHRTATSTPDFNPPDRAGPAGLLLCFLWLLRRLLRPGRLAPRPHERITIVSCRTRPHQKEAPGKTPNDARTGRNAQGGTHREEHAGGNGQTQHRTSAHHVPGFPAVLPSFTAQPLTTRPFAEQPYDTQTHDTQPYAASQLATSPFDAADQVAQDITTSTNTASTNVASERHRLKEQRLKECRLKENVDWRNAASRDTAADICGLRTLPCASSCPTQVQRTGAGAPELYTPRLNAPVEALPSRRRSRSGGRGRARGLWRAGP
ncbi:hypothetical protein SAMN05216268_117128 [Streptomyces yunnanensis]|uniref:Uncharacterized protein n=1 Tax=Streptomyces yunnanensis TaxID=156453 RepID=A0A9X8N4Z3_9ACTN|nr:hypothetical protein SAMN05216268_117128 [Streptomyces yunnanensis]